MSRNVDRSFVPSLGLCLTFIAGCVIGGVHVRRTHEEERIIVAWTLEDVQGSIQEVIESVNSTPLTRY